MLTRLSLILMLAAWTPQAHAEGRLGVALLASPINGFGYRSWFGFDEKIHKGLGWSGWAQHEYLNAHNAYAKTGPYYEFGARDRLNLFAEGTAWAAPHRAIDAILDFRVGLSFEYRVW